MTERQKHDQLLAQLLDVSGEQTAPPLTRGEERKLLGVAHAAGTPTLTPARARAYSPIAPGTFADEVIEVVRRYPIPALLLSIGVAYIAARRRR